MRRRAMVIGAAAWPAAAAAATSPEFDRRVQAFLDAKRPEWSRGVNYWNIRYEDGRRLHELVVARGFRRLLEIGTSTGHSAIWLAWAAARTGGRLVTIEIDRTRLEEARRNFEAAGVDAFIDAHLADAHELVRVLPGPWDLVFQDADKEGYLQYWRDLKGKMAPGGCYVADNVLRAYAPQVGEFVRAARADAAFETRIEDLGSGEGLLLACRR